MNFHHLSYIIIFLAFTFISIGYYLDYQLSKVALEKGYCQKVVEHKVIWTKCQQKGGSKWEK